MEPQRIRVAHRAKDHTASLILAEGRHHCAGIPAALTPRKNLCGDVMAQRRCGQLEVMHGRCGRHIRAFDRLMVGIGRHQYFTCL